MPLLRCVLATSLGLMLALIAGPYCIAWLARHFREPIKSISPTVTRLHANKAATPTMGGLFIGLGVVLVALVCVNLRDPRVSISLLTLVAYGALGAVDDWIKLRSSKRGMAPWAKLLAQATIAFVLWCLACSLGACLPSLFSAFLFALVLVAATNAVNVTDGLDGLAAGCGIAMSLALAAVLLASEQAWELAVLTSAMAGVLLGFLRFNIHPARVFMGNTGALALGGLLGVVSILGNCYFTGIVLGMVFVVEAASVVLQLASYRLWGRRLFLCAPLHHHFQFAGHGEQAIVRGFWLAAVLATFAGVGMHVAGVERRSTDKVDVNVVRSLRERRPF